MIYISLDQLNSNTQAVVVDFKGGHTFINKLNAIGIIKGKELIKISNSFLGGPVTVKVGQTKVAIGYGMAKKIMVKLVDNH